MAKWEKALTNPYNPNNKTSKDRVSKKMHVTPAPVNEIHLEDHERAHTGNPNKKIDHGQGGMAPTSYHALSGALNRGLD